MTQSDWSEPKPREQARVVVGAPVRVVLGAMGDAVVEHLLRGGAVDDADFGELGHTQQVRASAKAQQLTAAAMSAETTATFGQAD
ncbi:hypothetical protein ACW2Q0_21095 [Nocardia sp. R16R-3T]